MDTKAIMTFAPLVLIIVVFYFLMIRPQKKREKEVNAMRQGIRTGDRIITIGGIRGTVVKVADESLVIAIGADKTKMDIMRWAVSKVEGVGDVSPSKSSEAESSTPKTSKPKRLTKKTDDSEPDKKPRKRTTKKAE